MNKREKLIEALNNAEVNERDRTIRMSVEFRDEIVRQMTEPEPLAPEIEGGSVTWWWVCGECHGDVGSRDKYCRHCGREIAWDEVQLQRMRTEDD